MDFKTYSKNLRNRFIVANEDAEMRKDPGEGPGKVVLIEKEEFVTSEEFEYYVPVPATHEKITWGKKFKLSRPKKIRSYKVDDSFMQTKIEILKVKNRRPMFSREELVAQCVKVLGPSRVRQIKLQADDQDSINDSNVSWVQSAVQYIGDSLKSIASVSLHFAKVLLQNTWNWVTEWLSNMFPFIRSMSGFASFVQHFSFGLILLALHILGVSNRILGIALGVYLAIVEDSLPARISAVLITAASVYNHSLTNISVVNNNNVAPRPVKMQGVLNMEMFNKILTCAFGVLLVTQIPSDCVWDKLLSRCERLPKAISGTMSLSKHFEDAYGLVKQGALELLNMDSGVNEFPQDLDDNFKEVVALNDRQIVSQIACSPAVRERIQFAYNNYYNLRRQYHNNYEYRTLLDKYQGPINNLMQRVNDHTVGETETRQKPVLTMFRGGTGVGKSELLNYLATDLLADMQVITQDMTDENIVKKVNTSVFSRQVEVEYWDTYNNQPICLYDDFGQMVDSHTNPNIEFMEFIRAANRFPMTLHMAALAQKNVTFFTSRHILATTNLRTVNPQSLISADAVQSRIDFAYQVSVIPRYRVKPESDREIDQRLDINKLEKDDEGRAIPGTYIYQFQKWDVINNVVTPGYLTYDEVVQAICAKQNQYANLHLHTDKAIVKHFRRAHLQMFSWMKANVERAFEFSEEGYLREQLTRMKSQLSGARTRVRENPLWRFISSTEVIVVASAFIGMFIYQFTKRRQKLWFEDELTKDHQKIEVACCLSYIKRNGRDAVYDNLREPGIRTWFCGPFKRNIEIALAISYQFPETMLDLKEDFKEFFYDFKMDDYRGYVPEVDDILKKVSRPSWVTNFESIAQVYITRDPDLVIVRDKIEGKTVITFESGRNERNYKPTKIESGRDIKQTKAVTVESFKSQQSGEIANVVDKAFYIIDDTIPIFAVKDRWYLINRHYWLRLNGVFNVKQVGCNSSYDVDVKEVVVKNLERDPESDIICIQLPIRTHCNRDLTKHFVYKSELAAVQQKTTVLIIPPTRSNAKVLKTGKIHRYTTEQIDAGNGPQRMTYFESNIRSIEGDCGGMYILDSDDVKNKILGMHFAGAIDGGALGVPIAREDLNVLPGIQLKLPSSVENGVPSLVHAIPQGRVLKAPPSATRTSMCESELFGKVQETTVAPAKLGYIMDEVAQRGLNKVSGKVPIIDQNVILDAVSSYEKNLTGPKHFCRVLTFDEAVAGIEGEKLVRGISRGKSAGYPWSLESSRGKKKWFGDDDWLLGETAQPVRECVYNKISQLHRDVYEPSLYTDTLKDETRPIEKVQAGKTRVFSAASMDYVILFRMYFLGFLVHIMENRIHNEVSVGINALSSEWHVLAKRMLKFGRKRIIAGDFSDYDGTLHPDILWAVCDMANRWYDDGNDNVRRLIFYDIVHSWHVTGFEVNTWTHSQPSGNPGTAVVNSIYNSLAMRIAFQLQTGLPMHIFNNKVIMVSYGDDNLLAVSKDLNVNQQTFTDGLAKIGMIYTSEVKGAVEDFRDLEEVMFLKRGFRFEERLGLWVAPLHQNSINERLNWQHKVNNPRDVLKQNIASAIIEWALHDQETFEFWTKRISEAAKSLGEECEVYRQTYYLDLMRDGSLAKHFEFLTYV